MMIILERYQNSPDFTRYLGIRTVFLAL